VSERQLGGRGRGREPTSQATQRRPSVTLMCSTQVTAHANSSSTGGRDGTERESRRRSVYKVCKERKEGRKGAGDTRDRRHESSLLETAAPGGGGGASRGREGSRFNRQISMSSAWNASSTPEEEEEEEENRREISSFQNHLCGQLLLSRA
jgi:hypothetical protein